MGLEGEDKLAPIPKHSKDIKDEKIALNDNDILQKNQADKPKSSQRVMDNTKTTEADVEGKTMKLAGRHHEKNEKEKRALANYEISAKLPKGSATIDQVKATSAGVDGFANWRPTNKEKHPDMLEDIAKGNFDEDDDETRELKAEGRD